MPDEFESSIQKATDIGALGIIMPTVDTVEKAEAAVRYARYPPDGRRSQGGGQYSQIWASKTDDYHNTINQNMLVIVMIETPVGVANAYDIARVPGVDGVLIANTDLGNCSVSKPGSPEYEGMVKKIHDRGVRTAKTCCFSRTGRPLTVTNRPRAGDPGGGADAAALLNSSEAWLGPVRDRPGGLSNGRSQARISGKKACATESC
jgi:2-keto-3-deoxy-L-rhamnonate aldolase RhmA